MTADLAVRSWHDAQHKRCHGDVSQATNLPVNDPAEEYDYAIAQLAAISNMRASLDFQHKRASMDGVRKRSLEEAKRAALVRAAQAPPRCCTAALNGSRSPGAAQLLHTCFGWLAKSGRCPTTGQLLFTAAILATTAPNQGVFGAAFLVATAPNQGATPGYDYSPLPLTSCTL